MENEILQCIEEYLKEYADEYQRIVVEGGMFGDSIEFTAGYDFMKELMNYIKKQEQEIERLNNMINELDKLIEQYSRNDYYYKYNGKYLKSEIIEDLKELKENK